ncbi:MAG: efflux RND transporter periplasmic adaptor subunit [Pirellulaceae bacterium]
MSKRAERLRSIIQSVLQGLPVLLGLVVLAAIIAWISGIFQPKIQPGETQVPLSLVLGQPTDEVHEIYKDYIEEAVGTLKAASRSVISAKILATILQIHVTAGDFVSKDDLLVELNTQELNARLQQSREVLAAAQAATSNADANFTRNERLLQQNAVAQREYDQSVRELAVARADERRAEQAVNEAEATLSYATIRAPKNGRIVDRTAEPGDTAQPGAPILTLYDASSLRLETPVPENLAVQLTVGQNLTVFVDSVDQEFEATIDEIVPQADALSRSFLVKASLPRSDNLYEGMYGRLQIPAGTRRHLCLATEAIQRIGQLEFVNVVRDDGSLERRLIKTGRVGMPGRIEVLSGLQAGDNVVLYPAPGATQGNQEASSSGAAN